MSPQDEKHLKDAIDKLVTTVDQQNKSISTLIQIVRGQDLRIRALEGKPA